MWWLILAIYLALIAWSAYSVIREVAYWDGYQKGFADGIKHVDFKHIEEKKRMRKGDMP